MKESVDVGAVYKVSREQVRAHQPCTFKLKNICLWQETMKTPLALTVLIIFCFLKHISAKPVGIQMTITNVECCETISNRIHIPKKQVTHVVMTSSCSHEAIIVTTLADRKICLDPEWKHAQMHLEEFKKKTSSSTQNP